MLGKFQRSSYGTAGAIGTGPTEAQETLTPRAKRERYRARKAEEERRAITPTPVVPTAVPTEDRVPDSFDAKLQRYRAREARLQATKIAFASRRDGNLEIYVMNADGSEVTQQTNNPTSDRNPTWSPFLTER